MNSAWIYAVVSSSKQEDTVADQTAWARTAALEHGWEVTREFQGVSSGRDGVRKLLESLLAELRAIPKAARPERVLMIRIDRLGRGDSLDTIAALAEIRKLGVLVHTREDGDVAVKRATDALVPALRSITAALENETRGERSRAMHQRKRAAGEVQGLPPYGFVVVDHHLMPYEPEAAFLRDLFEHRARGWSHGKLSAYARSNAPAKRRKDGTLQPLRWATTTLIRMLANDAYRGTLIDQDLWDDVYAMRREHPIIARERRNPWPLRGALRCICGLAVSGRVSGAGKYRRRYYICMDSAAHGGYPGHDAGKIEAQFVAILNRLAEDPTLIASYRDTIDDAPLRARRATLERDRDSIAGRREKVWRLAENDAIPAAEVADRLHELKAEIDRLSTSIGELDREIARTSSARAMWEGVAEAVAAMARRWADSPIEVQQTVANAVSALVGGFWVDPKQQGALVTGVGEPRRKAEALLASSPSALAVLLNEKSAPAKGR